MLDTRNSYEIETFFNDIGFSYIFHENTVAWNLLLATCLSDYFILKLDKFSPSK